jgi:hypothetical protein
MDDEALGKALLNAVKPNRSGPEQTDPVSWLRSAAQTLARPDVRAVIDGDDPDSVDAMLFELRTLHDGLRQALRTHLTPQRRRTIDRAVKTTLRARLGATLDQVFVHPQAAIDFADGDLLVALSLKGGAESPAPLDALRREIEARLAAEGEHSNVTVYDLGEFTRKIAADRASETDVEVEAEQQPSPFGP